MLLMETLDDMPMKAEQIGTWTRRNPTLAHVLQFVQHEWPSHRDERDDVPTVYLVKQFELSVQMGASCGETGL